MRNVMGDETIRCPFCKVALQLHVVHREYLTSVRFTCPYCKRAISKDITRTEVESDALWFDHVCQAIELSLKNDTSYFEFR